MNSNILNGTAWTASQKLLLELEEQVMTIRGMQTFIREHASQFDQFSNNSSAGSKDFIRTIYLHTCSGDAKEICRALGGKWMKEHNGGCFNYEQKEPYHIVIFDAERKPSEALDL